MGGKDITADYKSKKMMFDLLNSDKEDGHPDPSSLETAPSTLGDGYQLQRNMEDILFSAIDPSDWKKECSAVSKQLLIPIKPEGLSDYSRRQQQVVGYLENITDFTRGQVPIMLDSIYETIKADLKSIKKQEGRLNSKNQG